MTATIDVFDLPARLRYKRDPALIAQDQQHFASIAASLENSIARLTGLLAAELKAPGGTGQAAMDRDLEVHRLTARLRTLRRFGLDLCLGRMVAEGADGAEPVYIGRLGLTDDEGGRLLLDWRSPAAEPFFGATHANPMGLRSRRRYRWSRGRISDYWDEVFVSEGFRSNAALDDQSAFIASLGSSRSPRMRDVLSTIQADQDAIIRAGSRGALVVDGGPGTGKTVVALHRAAYLLYSDPRLSQRRGSVLFVGPHQPYLTYVADVLPSLGEDGVQVCTLRDLVVEGADVSPEPDPAVARIKSSSALVGAVEAAVNYYERPPLGATAVETHWEDVRLDPADWSEAFAAPEPGTPHNEARDQIWQELVSIVARELDDEVPIELLRRSLTQNQRLRSTFDRAWPILDPVGVVDDLWSVPSYLRLCAPWLDAEESRSLHRERGHAWTVSDLPFLDAARQRIGDPQASARARRRDAGLVAEREAMDRVVDDLIAADDDGEGLVTILRGQDARESLIDESTLPSTDPDLLAGPFAHIVVDEAQELTDAEWEMLLRRCPSRSFTIVGDRAQARHGFSETWEQRLRRVGMTAVSLASLTINYRTPEEVMEVAEPAIRAALPDANVPTSIRRTGEPVLYADASALDSVLGGVAERACRRDGLRHRPGLCRERDAVESPRALADSRAFEGPRVRPRRSDRSGFVRRGHRGSGRPLRRDDPRHSETRHTQHMMTHPSLDAWPPTDQAFRRSEITQFLGTEPDAWARVKRDVLNWTVKTESGFTVDSTEQVTAGDRPTITARVLGMRILEPVEVVSVVETDTRVGFAYRTLPGHPVDGEEAFIVHRGDDGIWLTIRSLTRAAPRQPWRTLYPLLLVAQRVARRRYRHALL